jgi:hypothetical protein
MNRLILLVESRIRGDVYVRFGGEHLKTHRRNTAGRWVFSLLGNGILRNIDGPVNFVIDLVQSVIDGIKSVVEPVADNKRRLIFRHFVKN